MRTHGKQPHRKLGLHTQADLVRLVLTNASCILAKDLMLKAKVPLPLDNCIGGRKMLSALRSPLSALRSPLSALRSPLPQNPPQAILSRIPVIIRFATVLNVGGTIRNSYVTGTVSTRTDYMGFYVGGPVGENTGTLARAPLVADPAGAVARRVELTTAMSGLISRSRSSRCQGISTLKRGTGHRAS